MYVYKMLLLNRIREYKCLIRNMLFPILSFFVITGVIFYQLIILFIPVFKALKQVHLKGLLLVYLFLICNSFYGCFIRVKPLLIVKPITLYLFEEKKLKKLLRLKMIGKIIKHFVITFCLAVCVSGFHLNTHFFNIQILLFCLLESTALLSWQIYHHNAKSKRHLMKIVWFIICSIVFLSFRFFYITPLCFLIWLILIIHALLLLNLNRPKYEAEMIFIEKILTAQNHNNTVLLSRYAEEKKLFSLSLHSKTINQKFISKYPLTWKAKTSVYRLGRDKIIIGFVMFIITFFIYQYPVFHWLPFLDQTEIRYSFLLFGMLAVFQLTMQAMLQQLDSLLEKAVDGLFLPFSHKEIMLQFTIIPAIVMLLVLSIVSIILKCRIIHFILAAGMLLFLTILLFYLQVKRKKVFSQYYFVVTIVLFIISALLSH